MATTITAGNGMPAPTCTVTFYHDIEQDFDSEADPETCREMVREFLELERRYGARSTYNVVGRLYESQPDLIDWIAGAGQDLAFHSYNHHRDWNPGYYASEVELARRVSSVPKGYRSPRSQWGPETIESAWRNGYLWSAENEHRRDGPYFIHEGLVRLPIFMDDWDVFMGRITFDEWQERFRNAIRRKSYVAVGLHDCVACDDPEAWLGAWERLLKTASEENVLFASFSDAADLYRRGAVQRHYDLTAREWNRHSGTLYRSKRFQEIVRDEASKLERPIVADLASGGGVQSAGIRDIAGHIYCVDNSAAMVGSVEPADNVEGRLGELTDTTLPDDSIDFVFCVNAVEYLFWPEHLADEIRRIAKAGATYFVAFPALGGCPRNPPKAPPDRIERHFTFDEIERWASLVGPGTVFGIQYGSVEPESAEAEAAYRASELAPPDDVIPLFWAVVGKVDKDIRTPPRVRPLDSGSCTFRYRELRYAKAKRLLRILSGLIPEPLKKLARPLLGIKQHKSL